MFRRLALAPILAAVLAIGLALPAGATVRTSTSRNVVEILVARSSLAGFDSNPYDYDILITAAQTAGLVDALATTSNITVFAPDDAAFIRTARSLGFTGSGESAAWSFLVTALGQVGAATGIGDAVDVLTVVLQYHVAPQVLRVWTMLYKGVTGGTVNTLAGVTFRVRLIELVDKDPGIPNPYLNPRRLDLRASNGVIHGITRVLIPADI